MNIDVSLHPNSLKNLDLHGKTLIAVDVLRASSTIIVAVAKGVNKINIVETLDDARKMALMNAGSILIGEESSIKPDDFNYDNSPLALYLASDLENKNLIMRSSNGTPLLKAIQVLGDAKTYIGSFLNLEALTQRLFNEKAEDIIICCAGNYSAISLEDAGFAGALISCLKTLTDSVSLTDSAKLVLHLWNGINQDIDMLWKESSHATVLKHLGRG